LEHLLQKGSNPYIVAQMKSFFLPLLTGLIFSTWLTAQPARDLRNYQSLDNGTRYFSQGYATGDHPDWNDIIRMSLEKYGPDGQLIFSTAMLDAPQGIEMELKDNVWPGDVTEVFLHIHPGDTAEVLVPAWVADRDSSLKDSGIEYRYNIVLHGFTKRSDFEQRKAARLAELRKKEIGIFQKRTEAYSSKRIIRDSTGVVIVVLEESPDAASCMPGEAVTVHYILYLSEKGGSLDNSYQRGQPFTFQLGKGEVIKGWDIALPYLKQGEKALLMIPSWLAYGERGAGKDIAPDTPLYFEVEVMDDGF
jgi:FKBP-type peptidyl-prolyl cis-trans isomerase